MRYVIIHVYLSIIVLYTYFNTNIYMRAFVDRFLLHFGQNEVIHLFTKFYDHFDFIYTCWKNQPIFIFHKYTFWNE